MNAPPRRFTPEDSRVLMTEIVMPGDSNTHGTVFGGHVLALVDKASAIVAMRHCKSAVVTAAIDRVDFLAGARTGSILSVEALLHAVFRTSMEVGVSVFSEDPESGRRHLTCRAYVTLVALNHENRPTPVPPLELRGPDERRRAEEAAARRRQRQDSSDHATDPSSPQAG